MAKLNFKVQVSIDVIELAETISNLEYRQIVELINVVDYLVADSVFTEMLKNSKIFSE